ncbi:MAG: peptide chain release factor 1 [Phycisphaerae bacterium]|nr:PCRF domain-containing protein [Tepidisphaeraceae bacterium]
MSQATELSAPPALLRKLEEMSGRYSELQELLNDPTFVTQAQKMIAASREVGSLGPVVNKYREYVKAAQQVAELTEMMNGSDREMADLAHDELPGAKAAAAALLEELKDGFIAAEDNVVDSFFFEIRAGTGGEEAALFCRDLYEMYRKYCDAKRWQFIVSDFSVAERGGFKECIVNVKGDGAYRHLQYEAGGHRVQRVPETEAQGRIHTSAATVAVLPELEDVNIKIDPKDVEEFGCRGGGPGGQNVNKVETGWFIRHKPSGLTFKMTEHKSQPQNKERAWALLRSTLHQAEQAKQHAAQMGARKAMMGSGDRSARIRTYNFPQNRCTDHRLGGEGGGEKNFNLDQVMAGHLDELIGALLELDKRQRLETL